VAPVVVEGRKIAASFWGKAWCDNLESYRDYAYRVERGPQLCPQWRGDRSANRSTRGPGEGHRLGDLCNPDHDQTVARAAWTSICADCAGASTPWSSSCRANSPNPSWSASAGSRRPVSEAGRHQVLLQLSRFRLDVQACRGGALRPARGWTLSRICCFACARSTPARSSPISTRPCRHHARRRWNAARCARSFGYLRHRHGDVSATT